jgi:hypothetical protein
MKKILRLFAAFIASIIFLCSSFTLAQVTWQYDFGSGTGTYDTVGESTDFLPNAESNGGTARVAVCSTGGAFNLLNPGLFGSETSLKGFASSSGVPVNKFSVTGFSGTNLFTIRFDLCLDGGDSGQWYFFAGSGSQTYTGQTHATGNEVFVGLYWNFSSDSLLTTYYYNGSSWQIIDSANFVKGSKYTVDIFANNSNTSQFYGKLGQRSLANYQWDIWIGDFRLGKGFNKGSSFSNMISIDAFTFIGTSSVNNDAVINLDNIYYSNYFDPDNDLLPVELSSFTSKVVGSSVQLNWRTETELMNYGFEIERASSRQVETSPVQDWMKVGFVNGFGNSNSPKEYSFKDKNVEAGKYLYRLKQIDTDGRYEYSPVIEVEFGAPKEFKLNQNYPNPFNPSTKISFSLPVESNVSLTIYNMIGEKVLDAIANQVFEAGVYDYNFDGSKLSSGIYFYTIKTDKFSQTKKMLMIK